MLAIDHDLAIKYGQEYFTDSFLSFQEKSTECGRVILGSMTRQLFQRQSSFKNCDYPSLFTDRMLVKHGP